jgi:hypothetical protein
MNTIIMNTKSLNVCFLNTIGGGKTKGGSGGNKAPEGYDTFVAADGEFIAADGEFYVKL